MTKHHTLKGFTLIELAISLLIMGLLIAGLLGPLATRMEQKDRQATQETLDAIKEALYGFAITNGRLPCPDNDSDGLEDLEDLTTRVCTVTSNELPYVDLGVGVNDAWGNRFTYRVTATFADDTPGAACTPPGTATAGVSFELCSTGDIDIDSFEVDSTTGVGSIVDLVDDIPAVVFSGGQNNFASSTLEQENSNADAVFLYTDYRQATNEEFDDMMIWISPNILKNRMVQAGRLP